MEICKNPIIQHSFGISAGPVPCGNLCWVSFANFDGSTTHFYVLRFVAVSFVAVSFAISAGVVTCCKWWVSFANFDGFNHALF